MSKGEPGNTPGLQRLGVSNHYLLLGLLLLVLLLALLLRGSDMLGSAYLNLALINLGRFERVDLMSGQVDANTEAVEDLLLDAAQYSQTQASAKRMLGQIFLAQGDMEKAVSTWQSASFPAETALAFGQHAESLRDWPKAVAWYEIASQTDFAGAAADLGRLYGYQGNDEAAIELFRRVLHDYAGHAQRLEWWHGLSGSLDKSEQWQQSIAASERALAEFPEEPALLTFLGRALYFDKKDPVQAVETIKQAAAIDDTYAPAFAAIGLIMEQEERYEEAYDWYSQAVERDQTIPWWHVAQANMALHSGDLDLAANQYQETMEAHPDYAPTYYEASWLYKLQDDPDQAITAIEKALALTNAPPAGYTIRAAQIYEWAGLRDEAFRAYQSAAEIAPNNELIQEGLARLQQE